MKRAMSSLATGFLVILEGTSCVNQIDSVLQEEAFREDGPSKSVLIPLVVGETYQTIADRACQKHTEPNGYSWFLCTSLSRFNNAPDHIWQLNVCKLGMGAEGLEGIPLEASQIRWYVTANGVRLGADYISYTDGPCLDLVPIDLSKLSCNQDAIIGAEISSPSDCASSECAFISGGIVVRRSCLGGSSTE